MVCRCTDVTQSMDESGSTDRSNELALRIAHVTASLLRACYQRAGTTTWPASVRSGRRSRMTNGASHVRHFRAPGRAPSWSRASATLHRLHHGRPTTLNYSKPRKFRVECRREPPASWVSASDVNSASTAAKRRSSAHPPMVNSIPDSSPATSMLWRPPTPNDCSVRIDFVCQTAPEHNCCDPTAGPVQITLRAAPIDSSLDQRLPAGWRQAME